jgi:hypothetical protein
MIKINNYQLPSSGPARELLRTKGQFWTPDWVAEAMVEYVLADGNNSLFDPAVGAGAFLRAGKAIAQEKGIAVKLEGMDVDPAVVQQGQQYGLSPADLEQVRIDDFIFHPPASKLKAIVANPPYIRHHRLSAEIKEQLKAFGERMTGQVLDGRAGLHIYFLIRALERLDSGGRLAFIVPADTAEGVFAPPLWQWITRHYCLDAVITFDPDATPFPNVDTNPLIFLIQNARPQAQFYWVRTHQPCTDDLKQWIRSGFTLSQSIHLSIKQRSLSEGLSTGFSRPPLSLGIAGPTLGDFAKVMRGVATGANDFFFLTQEQAKQYHIPESYFIPAIGRTRDVPDSEITNELMTALQKKGRPTLLLSLDSKSPEAYPDPVRLYLEAGRQQGLPDKPLLSQRRPWYKMESRPIPPFLFAYLGRRSSRFIRNVAGVIPLTCFLCVYPNHNDPDYIAQLWQVLNHPETTRNLSWIGKSYGSGAVKVEPRALEKLPLTMHLVQNAGLPYMLRLL